MTTTINTQTLDLKGREKFLNQVSVQSYVGCSHCQVVFPTGNGGPCFGVARKYLPIDHPLREESCGSYCQFKEREHEGAYFLYLNNVF